MLERITLAILAFCGFVIAAFVLAAAAEGAPRVTCSATDTQANSVIEWTRPGFNAHGFRYRDFDRVVYARRPSALTRSIVENWPVKPHAGIRIACARGGRRVPVLLAERLCTRLVFRSDAYSVALFGQCIADYQEMRESNGQDIR
jgi:hypothetical protein